MLSSRFVTKPQTDTDIKVFSLSSPHPWRLKARHFIVFVGLLSLSMHLSNLMAKNDAKPVMWTPPVEPPGAVIVTHNSFTPPTPVSETLPAAQAASVNVAAVNTKATDRLVNTPSLPHPKEADKESANEELIDALSQWSEAWRKQDMGRYLAAYAPSFAPAKGTSREAWAKQRTVRISAKKNIRHEVRDVSVQIAQNKAIVKFTQVYADERLQQTDHKTMHWVLSDGRWLIARELTQ